MSDPHSVEEKESLLGKVLGGKYRIERVLGEGGVGIVYRAQHIKLRHTVAVKVLSGAKTAHPDVKKRFEREARALSALSHPNIVGVTDFGMSGELIYFAMEYLEGQTLAGVLGPGVPVEPERAVEIIRQVLDGLSFAHARGVLHRDLKPANVFLQKLPGGDEHVKVLDFGLAKILEAPNRGKEPTLTRDGAILGTPAYMAPEQASGGRVDLRSDVYSVGVLLFEMLAGRCPFVANNYIDVLHGHLFEPVPKLSDVNTDLMGTPELEHLLQKSMAKSQEDRFTDAMDMLRALQGLSHPVTKKVTNQGGKQPKVVLSSPPSDLFTGPFPLSPGGSIQRRVSLEETRPVRYYPADDSARRRLFWVLGILGALLIVAGVASAAVWFASESSEGNDGAHASDVKPSENAPSEPSASEKVGALEETRQKDKKDKASSAGEASRETASVEKDGEEPSEVESASPSVEHKVLGTLLGSKARAVEALTLGNRIPDTDKSQLQKESKKSVHFPVAQVLLGHDAFLAKESSSALQHYERALKANPKLRDYEPMLGHLLALAGGQDTHPEARKLVAEIYGPKILPVVERAIDDKNNSKKAKNRLRRLRKKLRKLSK